jgi:hypothetical protein
MRPCVRDRVIAPPLICSLGADCLVVQEPNRPEQ